MNPFRRSAAGAALILVLAACSGGPGPASSMDPADADVRVTAVNLAWEESTLTAPAGRAFTLALFNEDPEPHNVAIYTDESKAEKVFEGEPIGDGTIVYEIPALEPGEYYFDCTIHPDMQGTLVVEG